ncbi:hypothetical protein [Acinetobacter stercoris]|uniref:DUF5655 domain-containing protein n=1 Tax=Acinetobacter stercoris TaxID=2126983 RepID=A0A2U3N3B4_9GAMM|nr:hypothetical protein [Acinetobacter stercoris]SPL72039.1 hypothetical protein KPC_3217 [Acinetobacter stercoris]
MYSVEKELILKLIEFSDSLNQEDKIKFTDFSFKVYKNKIKLLASILLNDGFIIIDDNDEVVLDLELDRVSSRVSLDVTDSLGKYYLEINDNMSVDLIFKINNIILDVIKSMTELK